MYSLLNGTGFEGGNVGLYVENPVTSWFNVFPDLGGTLKVPGVPVINVLVPVVVAPEAKLTPVLLTFPAGSVSNLFKPAYLKNCCS